jgi:hypothetical protein
LKIPKRCFIFLCTNEALREFFFENSGMSKNNRIFVEPAYSTRVCKEMRFFLEKVHGPFPIFLKLFADWDLP